MTEKQFEFYSDDDLIGVLDTVTGKTFNSFEIVDKLNEQQATIRKLQDLCGKSDYENAKLRIKNKRLQAEIRLLKPTNIEQYEQIQKLQEENEQLKYDNFMFKGVIETFQKVAISERKKLEEKNEQLRKQCFELEKDYLIETSDISDKIYLGDEIKELKQRYGVDDE